LTFIYSYSIKKEAKNVIINFHVYTP